MNLSTSTDIYQDVREQKHYFSLVDAVYACKEAGFTHIDLTLTEHCAPDSPFAGPEWRRWLADVQDALGRTGLTVNQTHTLFYKHIDAEETLAFNEKMVDRCLEASALVGARWTVMHILRTIDLNLTVDQKEEALKRNVEYFIPYGDKARKYGVGIAIENGLSGFFHSAAELQELLSNLKDSAFGLCWDTGHANITGQDQPASVRALGDQLKCLHINDNHGQKDEHLLPFFGTVDFAPILAAIHSLNDPPILTFEARGSTRMLPPLAHRDILRAAVKIGEYLNNM